MPNHEHLKIVHDALEWAETNDPNGANRVLAGKLKEMLAMGTTELQELIIDVKNASLTVTQRQVAMLAIFAKAMF